MADGNNDQLMIEIGARTDSFAASLIKVAAKASSAMSLIEARGQGAADKLTGSFAKVGGGNAFSGLTKGMASAEGGVSKLQSKFQGLEKTIAGTFASGQSALIKRVQDAGGIGNLASSLGSGASTALVTGGAAFLGFEAIKMSITEIIKASEEAEKELARLIKIGTDASAVGMGTSFFQAFTQGSKKLGLEASDLTSILSKLAEASKQSLGTGDDLNPSSSAQDAINAHISAGNLSKGDAATFDAAGTQQERLKAVLAMIGELQNKGAQLASFDLAGKIFGSDFEAKLRENDGLIAKLQARIADIANGKGANVIPPEQIQAAKDLDAEMESLNDRVINALTPFHNDLRGWQQEELRSTLELKGYWVDIVEVFGQLYAFADKIGAKISSWGNAAPFQNLVTTLNSLGLIDKDIAIQLNGPKKPVAGSPDTSTDTPTLTVTKRPTDTSKPLPETKDKGHEAAEKTDGVQNLIDELGKAVAVEEAEARTQGLSNKAKQEAIDLAKLKAAADREDRAATADETAQILKLADAAAAAAAKDKVALLNRQQEQAKELAGFLGNEFESSVEKLVSGSGKLTDVLKSVVTALEQAALKALILGEGPLAGLFGTAAPIGATGAASVGGIFGNVAHLFGFAEGGQISGPGSGTSDSIMARLSDGEFVVNARATKANLGLLHAINGSGAMPKFASGGMVGAVASPMLSTGGSGAPGAGSSIVVNMGDTHVNANGGTPAQNQDLAKQVSAQMAEMVNKAVVGQIMKQMRPGNILRNAY